MSDSPQRSAQGGRGAALTFSSPIRGNPTPAYALGGALITTMVGLAVVMAINFKGSSPPKPQQVQGPPPTVDISGAASGATTEPVAVATATPTTAPATKAAASTKPAPGKPHVDLLAKIDLTRDV